MYISSVTNMYSFSLVLRSPLWKATDEYRQCCAPGRTAPGSRGNGGIVCGSVVYQVCPRHRKWWLMSGAVVGRSHLGRPQQPPHLHPHLTGLTHYRNMLKWSGDRLGDNFVETRLFPASVARCCADNIGLGIFNIPRRPESQPTLKDSIVNWKQQSQEWKVPQNGKWKIKCIFNLQLVAHWNQNTEFCLQINWWQ